MLQHLHPMAIFAEDLFIEYNFPSLEFYTIQMYWPYPYEDYFYF
jgi:hypothetical protein